MLKFSTRSFLTSASCLALAGFAFTPSAQANVPSFSSASPWLTSTSTNAGTQSCAVTGTFDNGFIVDMGGQHGHLDVISVNFRQDIFDAGETYNANIHVPGMATSASSARAIDKSTLGIPVGNKDQIFAAIKNARSFNLGVENNEFSFDLRDFGNSVTFLEGCQARAETPIKFAAPAASPVALDTVSSSPATTVMPDRPQARKRYIDRLDSSMRTNVNAAAPVELVTPPAAVVEDFKATTAPAPVAESFDNRPQKNIVARTDLKAPTPLVAPNYEPAVVTIAEPAAAPVIVAPAAPQVTITAPALSDDPQPRPTPRTRSLIRTTTVSEMQNVPAAPTEPPVYVAPAPTAEPIVVASPAPTPTLALSSFDDRPQKNARRDMSATWGASQTVSIDAPKVKVVAPSTPTPEPVIETPMVYTPSAAPAIMESDLSWDDSPAYSADYSATPATAGTLSVASIGDVLGVDKQPRPTTRNRSLVYTNTPAASAPQVRVAPTVSAPTPVVVTPETSMVMVKKPDLSAPEPYFAESNIMQRKRSATIEADFTDYAAPVYTPPAPSADDLGLRQRMAELENKVDSLKMENQQLESELDFAIDAGRSEKASISSSNWDLEKATMMQNEAERQVKRLGMQLQKERARHEQEKAELETMLFDPAVTSQEQMAKLSTLELELSEKEEKLFEQRRLYEERIRILEGQLNN